MDDSTSLIKPSMYKAPSLYVILFYMALTAWTIVSVPLIYSKASGMSTTFLLIIAFFIVYTWYFSLGISYRVKIESDGSIQLTSLRKTIRTHSEKIYRIEAPPFPIWIGFTRFRLEREVAYLFFSLKDRSLQRIFSLIRMANPEITFKGSMKNFSTPNKNGDSEAMHQNDP